MPKTAIVTGATGGIGKSLALQLARRGYTVHGLGRSPQLLQNLAVQLRAAHPAGEHRTFAVDLGTRAANASFLRRYQDDHTSLDLLVLCAGAVPNRPTCGPDGLDTTFVVSYLSRFMFTTFLDSMLQRAAAPRVIQIGGATMLAEIDYRRLPNPDYGSLRSVAMAFMAAARLAVFATARRVTLTPHVLYEPGVVNTRIFRDNPIWLRMIVRLCSRVREPDQVAARIADHVANVSGPKSDGKIYHIDAPQRPHPKLANDAAFDQQLEFSRSFSDSQSSISNI